MEKNKNNLLEQNLTYTNNEHNLKICIIESKLKKYKTNEICEIQIKNKLGSGSYGVVFDIENNLVIKIFYNSVLGRTCFEEKDCIIPYKNENRELSFYFKLMKENPINHINNHMIAPLVIGYLKNDFQYSQKDNFKKESYFVVLPLCIPFHKFYKIKNNPLIDVEDSLPFLNEFSKKVLGASIYMENKYNIINLDFKLTNIMYLKDNSIFEEFKNENSNDKNEDENEKELINKYHKNLLVLDFSLIKKKDSNKLFSFDEWDKKNGEFTYYLWPKEEDKFYLSQLPSYSVGINLLELLLGKDKVTKLPNNILIKDYIKKISKKYKKTALFLEKCLLEKITSEQSYQLIDHLLID
jgi:hypothetical protein